MVSCHADYATTGAWKSRADCFVGWSERVRACHATDYMTIHLKSGAESAEAFRHQHAMDLLLEKSAFGLRASNRVHTRLMAQCLGTAPWAAH